MTHLFVSYPCGSYYHSHIYEQLLAFELQNRKIKWKTGNIGSGYIYVETEQKLSQKDVFDLLSLPNLTKNSIGHANYLVREETMTNLNFKPAFEFLHFRVKTYPALYEIINSPVTLQDIEKIKKFVLTTSSIRIIVDNKIVFSREKRRSGKKYKEIPWMLRTPDKKHISYIFRNEARNALDGYLLDVVGRKINKILLNEGIDSKYLSILGENSDLYLTFLAPIDGKIQKIMGRTNEPIDFVIEGPIHTIEKLDEQKEGACQYFDWGKVVLPEKILKRFQNSKGLNVRIFYNQIAIS